jgi:tetratricopeptide (TPR) repeat protein
MNSTKLSAFCDQVLETGWLLAVIITPLLFNVYSSRVFEPDKLTTLRTVAVIMAAVWLVKIVEERASGRREMGFTWRTPLVLPTLFMVVVYLLSTLLSVTFWVSLLGSYQRLQATYTVLSYVVVFLVILQGLRTRAQLDRLITAMILNSLPIALYGLIQRNRLDPLPWGGDVTRRVASNMGNPIFVAAYLIMIFPLVVGRIAESFQAILTEEEANWADVCRAAGYIFVAAVDLIAIWYAQSRGPLLGLITASYFLFLLLALSARSKWGAVVALTTVAVTALVVGFLVTVNVPGGPLQSLQRAPWLGRLGEVFDFERGTGKVRALIWEGMADLILPHEPIQYPDGHADPYNGLRLLVGYGPESIYVAYNRFYPPLLGHYESRTASPDRAHNETLDSLAMRGLLGLVAYLWVFGSVFYYGFRWLGLVEGEAQRGLLGGLVAGWSAASVAFFWWWQGANFFGAALTLGIVAGLGIYLAIRAIVASVQLLRGQEEARPALHAHHYLLLSLVTAVIAHFVEINFGIAIASTRTTFWAYAGVFVVAGLNLIREREAEPGGQEEPGRKQASRKRRKRRRAAPPVAAGAALPGWLGPTLAMGVVGGFILGTLAFDFTTNAERLAEPLAIVWRALTVLPAQGGRTSYGALMVVGLTWVMGAALFIPEMARGGAFRERPGDGTLAAVVYLLVSLTVGLGFALVLAGRQAALVGVQAQTLEDVVDIADRVASLLTAYYWFIVCVVVGGGAAFLVGRGRLPRQAAHPWGVIALVVLLVLAGATVVRTNLHPIQADIVYKQADPYDRQGQWLVAIEHYKHALELAPKEDFYHLYLGRAYLEYASTLEDPAVREAVLRETEQVLTEAREINPLNTDHSANLARMYSRWMSFAPDDATRAALAEKSVANYAIATTLSPHNVILWNEWALLYLTLGDLARAQEKVSHSLALDPEYDETWWKVQASIYASQNRITDAIGAYERALEIDARRTDTWLLLGDTHVRQSQLAEAAEAYEHALELNPNHTQVWRVLGSVYAQLGRLDEGVGALERALELAPEASDAWDTHRMLAIIHSQLGQGEAALHHAQIALELAPEDQQPGLQDLLAQLQPAPEGGQP